jgi:hypothetical protein
LMNHEYFEVYYLCDSDADISFSASTSAFSSGSNKGRRRNLI